MLQAWPRKRSVPSESPTTPPTAVVGMPRNESVTWGLTHSIKKACKIMSYRPLIQYSVVPTGIEPVSWVPETHVVSILLRDHDFVQERRPFCHCSLNDFEAKVASILRFDQVFLKRRSRKTCFSLEPPKFISLRLSMTRFQTWNPARSQPLPIPSSTDCRRFRSNIPWMSIFTGHTEEHPPQREDA